jgi:hypothetical protein
MGRSVWAKNCSFSRVVSVSCHSSVVRSYTKLAITATIRVFLPKGLPFLPKSDILCQKIIEFAKK